MCGCARAHIAYGCHLVGDGTFVAIRPFYTIWGLPQIGNSSSKNDTFMYIYIYTHTATYVYDT